jgi:hypothetical protein
MRLASAALVGLLLSGCSVMSEETRFAMEQEMLRLRGYDWGQATAQLTGVRELVPTARQQEMQAEQEICLHRNSRGRVVQQTGVSDAFEYRRCPLAPYDMQGGQRLRGRND